MIPRVLPCLALLAAASCVTVDPETNEVLPRGNQRHTMEVVRKRAEDLEVGMSKLQVLATLGSPAEETERGDVWIYLPERPAVLVPSRALQLRFEDDHLADFGYHAIVLGQRL